MRRFKKYVVIFLTMTMITASFAGMAVAAPKTGWQKEDGVWYYYENDGVTRKTGWFKENGKWYYLDAERDGAMIAGQAYNIDGKYYVFSNGGVMQSDGWAKVKTKMGDGYWTDWYFLNKGGSAKMNKWVKDGGKWFYLGAVGVMVNNGSFEINGKYYLFGSNGAWISEPGWHKIGIADGEKAWYYLKENGTCKNGWLKENGKWYFLMQGYMVSNGAVDTNQNYDEEEHIPDQYLFNKNGTMVTEAKWLKCVYHQGDNTFTFWYYGKTNGRPVKGWKKIEGKWYYFDPHYATLVQNEVKMIDDQLYFFEKSGALTEKTGWKKLTKTVNGEKQTLRYYLDEGGICLTGWQKIGKKWYYFDELTGEMVTGKREINGKEYTFDADGVWKK